MAKVYSELSDDLIAFIKAQPLFFVATAPLDIGGHVNVSPKGLDCLRVLAPDQVAYLDLTGSGNETSAHITENGRITVMFCAFTGDALILRLFGTGTTFLPGSAGWETLAPHFPTYPGARQIIRVDIHRVQTSCGFGVPEMELVAPRETLVDWAAKMGDERMGDYQRRTNTYSIDGIPTPLGMHLAAETDAEG